MPRCKRITLRSLLEFSNDPKSKFRGITTKNIVNSLPVLNYLRSVVPLRDSGRMKTSEALDITAMEYNQKAVDRLERDIYKLNRHDREYLRLRVEFLLLQIDAALCRQYQDVRVLDDGADLLAMLEDAMSETERFRQWFRECVHSDGRMTIESYLSCGVEAGRHGKAVRRILSKIMIFLPRWLNIDIGGCHGRTAQLRSTLCEGYRLTIVQGT